VPELPEVEVVRRGLQAHAADRTVTSVQVLHPRAVRRHEAGADDFVARLTGRPLLRTARRGKYLWLPLGDAAGLDGAAVHAEPAEALVAHLGMSGQLVVQPAGAEDELHLRVRLRLSDGREVRFVDQRTFGGLSVAALDGDGVPEPVAHIARDPLDPAFDDDAFVVGLRRRRTGLKRALLDQTLVSGIGNIYADEALWRSRLHYARATDTLRRPEAERLLGNVRDVMGEALAEGGTSFDALYVDVNGQSGYFDRSLAAYGQVGRPCPRCGTPVRRDPFMNRSSFTCPRCQPRPRHGRW
jgi:formamidopyrimidine-DNA glycosylase